VELMQLRLPSRAATGGDSVEASTRWHEPRLARTAGKILGLAVAAVVVTVVGFLAVDNTALIRPIIAGLIAATIVAVAIRRPRAAVLLAFAFLALLPLLRRLLIVAAGWTSYDPLLLVAPVVAALLVAPLFLSRKRTIVAEPLSKLVLALLLLAIAETANPRGGGLMVGISGLLFVGAPLLWFFIGKEIADRRTITVLTAMLALWAFVVAIYGLAQTTVGLPPWDSAWLQLGGYATLRVHGVVRAFGTFSSSSEYAMFLAIGIVVGVAMLFHGRRLLAALTIPLLAWALFLDSSRGILILALLGVIALVGLRMRHLAGGIALVVIGIAVSVATLQAFGPSIEASDLATGNPLISHQVTGILHPFNTDQSTLLSHWNEMLYGVAFGIQNPLGLGTATTTIAAEKLGVTTQGTETDISNAFVSLGLAGGLLVFGIILVSLATVAALYRRHRDVLALAIAGVLVVSIGQWLNGEQYTVAPLIWCLIGWVTGEATRRARSAPARRAPAPRVVAA
jgi:hypothetical protein